MSKERYFKRQLEQKLLKLARTFPSVVLSGPRQSGKSTLLKNLFGETHQYVTFDDPVIKQKCLEDPKLFFDSLKEYVIFDEIQYVPQLLSYIKIAIDEKRSKNGRYIITGSQQFNLIKNLGDTLAGRTALQNLFPFDVFEAKQIPSRMRVLSSADNAFIHFCINGSFPNLLIHPKLDSSDWYASYLQTYLERDVKSLYNVGSLLEFQRFLQLLASRCSQTLNLSAFASDLGIAVNTIKNWLSILMSSNIVILLYPYYRNIGKRIVKAPKVYFIDCGLVAYLTGIKSKETLLAGPMAGAFFENHVVAETYKIISNHGEVPRLFYLRTHKGEEVDLLIEKEQLIYPFEIKLTKTPRSGMTSAMEKLFNEKQKMDFKKGKLICLIKESLPLTKNVSAVNAMDYFRWLNV